VQVNVKGPINVEINHKTIFPCSCFLTMHSIPQTNFSANFKLGFTIIQNGVLISKLKPESYCS